MTAIKDALIGARFLDKGGAVFNVRHPSFGGVGDGVADDGKAFNLARTAVPSTGGIVLVPPGTYLLTTAFTFASQTGVQLLLLPGVVLTGSALPTPSGTNAIFDQRDNVLVLTTKTPGLRLNDTGTPRNWNIVVNGTTGFLSIIDLTGSTTRYKIETDGKHTVTGDVAVSGSLDVGDELDLAGDIELAEQTTAVVASPQNNFATGTVTVLRISTTVTLTITGLAGGRAGRIIYFQKVAPLADIIFTHEDVNSTAVNRVRTHNGSSFTLTSAGAMWIRYDSILSRWMLGPHSN